MNEIIVIVLFIIWYAGSLIISESVKKSKIGTEWMFFISMIFSPVIGLLVYLFAKEK